MNHKELQGYIRLGLQLLLLIFMVSFFFGHEPSKPSLWDTIQMAINEWALRQGR